MVLSYVYIFVISCWVWAVLCLICYEVMVSDVAFSWLGYGICGLLLILLFAYFGFLFIVVSGVA